MDYRKPFQHTIKVSHTDLDDLNHVNNIRYLKWIEDIAKAHWKKIASKEMYNSYYWIVRQHLVDYKASAHLNDEVKITTRFLNCNGARTKSIIEMHNNSTSKLLLKAETVWCLMAVNTKRPTRVTEEIDSILA